MLCFGDFKLKQELKVKQIRIVRHFSSTVPAPVGTKASRLLGVFVNEDMSN